jgi:hypothetical protein
MASDEGYSRRAFLGTGLAAGTGWALGPGAAHGEGADDAGRLAQGTAEAVPHVGSPSTSADLPLPPLVRPKGIDLSPARWIWYPSGRTLPNTVVLFRRTIDLAARPTRAHGMLLGDSRYVLYVNGTRVQFGPAPSDPRWSGGRPLRHHAAPRRGRERDRHPRPLLRLRRGHVAGGEAGAHRAARHRGRWPRSDPAGDRCIVARAPGPRVAAGPVQAVVPAIPAGGLRRAPVPARLVRARV